MHRRMHKCCAKHNVVDKLASTKQEQLRHWDSHKLSLGAHVVQNRWQNKKIVWGRQHENYLSLVHCSHTQMNQIHQQSQIRMTTHTSENMHSVRTRVNQEHTLTQRKQPDTNVISVKSIPTNCLSTWRDSHSDKHVAITTMERSHTHSDHSPEMIGNSIDRE